MAYQQVEDFIISVHESGTYHTNRLGGYVVYWNIVGWAISPEDW